MKVTLFYFYFSFFLFIYINICSSEEPQHLDDNTPSTSVKLECDHSDNNSVLASISPETSSGSYLSCSSTLNSAQESSAFEEGPSTSGTRQKIKNKKKRPRKCLQKTKHLSTRTPARQSNCSSFDHGKNRSADEDEEVEMVMEHSGCCYRTIGGYKKCINNTFFDDDDDDEEEEFDDPSDIKISKYKEDSSDEPSDEVRVTKQVNINKMKIKEEEETETEDIYESFTDDEDDENLFYEEIIMTFEILKNAIYIDLHHLNTTVNPLIITLEMIFKGTENPFSIQAFNLIRSMKDTLLRVTQDIPEETKQLLDQQYIQFSSVDWVFLPKEEARTQGIEVLNMLPLNGEYPNTAPEASHFLEIHTEVGKLGTLFDKLKKSLKECDNLLPYTKYSIYDELVGSIVDDLSEKRVLLDQMSSKMQTILNECIIQMSNNQYPTIPRSFLEDVKSLSKEEGVLVNMIREWKDELVEMLKKRYQYGPDLIGSMIEYFFLHLAEHNKAGIGELLRNMLDPTISCGTQQFWHVYRNEGCLLSTFIRKAVTEFKRTFRGNQLDSLTLYKLQNGSYESKYMRRASYVICAIVSLQTLLAQIIDFKNQVKDLVGDSIWDQIQVVDDYEETNRTSKKSMTKRPSNNLPSVLFLIPNQVKKSIVTFENFSRNLRILYTLNRFRERHRNAHQNFLVLKSSLHQLDFHTSVVLHTYLQFSQTNHIHGNILERDILRKKLYRSLYFAMKASSVLL